jgi:hypothetical protein
VKVRVRSSGVKKKEQKDENPFEDVREAIPDELDDKLEDLYRRYGHESHIGDGEGGEGVLGEEGGEL